VKEWWSSRTLRFRLASWYAVGGTVLLAAFSATIYFYVSQRIARPLDHELRLDLAVVAQRMEISPQGVIKWDGKDLADGSKWQVNDPWFELWDEKGQLVRRLWPFAESRISRLPVAPARGRETISVFAVGEDTRLRVLSVPFHFPGREEDGMIRVMRVHEPVGEALRALLGIIVVSLPVVVIVLVVGGYALTRRWLKPLDQMVAEANRISVDDLHRRLPVKNPRDELGQLATVFNVTLDRLEDSFEALDRFVGDASHELRTPLTTLRSVGEVGLRRSRTVEEYREIIGSMLEEAQRMQLLVQRLLELATAESGAQSASRTRLRIDQFVVNCVGELSILAEARGQTIALTTEPCEVVTDPIIFRQALQNLLDNAIKYAPERSTILVSVADAGNVCLVSVTDTGPGVRAEDRARLAERFYRPDSSRAGGQGGFGLGLSITKAYMRVLNGSLVYETMEPQGSRFRLTLPKPTFLTP
jgi:heavy metal sensor kinase